MKEVIAFWDPSTDNGMVCVTENKEIIDSILSPVSNEGEFVEWRKQHVLRLATWYKVPIANIKLVK